MKARLTRKAFLLSVAVLMVLLIMSTADVYAEERTYVSLYSEEEEAYLIQSVEDLKIFRNSLQNRNYEGEKVLLTKDLSLTPDDDIGDTGGDVLLSGGKFSGYFDGQNHQISGFRDEKHGLLGEINKGTATRIHLSVAMEDVTIKSFDLMMGTKLYGPLADRCFYGRIQYCTVDGVLSSSQPVARSIGGLVGGFSASSSQPGYIRDCKIDLDIDVQQTTGTYFPRPMLGGITCGVEYAEQIQNCVSLGTLKTNYSDVYATFGAFGKAAVRSENGSWRYSEDGKGCFYNANAAESHPSEEEYKNGHEYYMYSEGGQACTAEELQQLSLYAKADYNMDGVWEMGEDGYPALRTDVPASSEEYDGDAVAYQQLYQSEVSAYVIEDVEDLAIFRSSLRYHDYAGEKVLLHNDISIELEDKIGNYYNEINQTGGTFKGYFDGQGYTISGFQDGCYGLIGSLEGNGMVTRLKLV